jgi:hypothetical protein
MAAEMATGAPALVLTTGAPASVAMLLRGIEATFTKRIQGPSTFTFEDVAGMQAAILRAAESGESEAYSGSVIGHTAQGEPASTFRITWSFKRRG